MDDDCFPKLVEETHGVMVQQLITFIQHLYNTEGKIPLHAPFLFGNECDETKKVLESGLFSSSSPVVSDFEKALGDFIASKKVLATNSGTAALHTALLCAGVSKDELVITQALSFVATANAISYCGASPVFVDIDRDTLSLSAEALDNFLKTDCQVENGECIHSASQKKIRACIIMHTFGHVGEVKAIQSILKNYHILLIEDAAQAFGSTCGKQFAGTIGDFGIYSFNGNKTITTGGGGALVCKNEVDFKKAQSIISQGKTNHPYIYHHHEIGYNYKMTGLAASVGLQQLAHFTEIKTKKQVLTEQYRSFLGKIDIHFIESSNSNDIHWLNNILLESQQERDHFLEELHKHNIEARPVWEPLYSLPMYKNVLNDGLENTKALAPRILSLPSGSLFNL